MSYPRNNSLALFSLYPLNAQAHDVLDHPRNRHLVAIMSNNTRVLDVGFNVQSQSRNTLATLGRNDTDIIVEGAKIGRIQCSFEIDPDSRVVMLYDRSNAQTTQVFGESTTPFEHGRLRRVVVQKGLNTIVGIGGVKCDFVRFELIWHQDPLETVDKIKSLESMFSGLKENPRLARTENDTPTVLPSQGVFRMRRMIVGPPLGSGQFGIVHKCVDVDSGKFMALKILTRPPGKSQEQWREELYRTLKREVEILSIISHPHIIEYIASQGWEEQKVEIFMGLKEGTLQSLTESESGLPSSAVETVFGQMLQALDCLAYNGIIHRDVKPDNILYATLPDGQYHFQLGDFGFCNRAINAASLVGSPLFMAPEIYQGRNQTSKVDVWSLFITLVWILNTGGFREKFSKFSNMNDIQEAIVHAASQDAILFKVREMAIIDPQQRASAAQIIMKLYDGVGLSTPRSQIPAIS